MSVQRILIVDDEASVRTFLFAAVCGREREVFSAQDGPTALELAGLHSPFDLVITDITMPGMTGLELAARLQTRGYAHRFVFVSGYYDGQAFDESIGKFESAIFLAKPFNVPELLRTVRNQLDETQRLRAGAALRTPHSAHHSEMRLPRGG